MRKHTLKILLFLFMLTTLSGAALAGPDGILSPRNPLEGG